MNTYEVNLKPEGNRKQKLIASIFPQISEEKHFGFGKKTKKTAPQNLLESINSCLMATFLDHAANSNIQIISFGK
jgi:hypothetical protein